MGRDFISITLVFPKLGGAAGLRGGRRAGTALSRGREASPKALDSWSASQGFLSNRHVFMSLSMRSEGEVVGISEVGDRERIRFIRG